MSDIERVKLELEAKKKSGWLAAFLNLILPGAGYIYCARSILGILALVIGVILAIGAFTVPGLAVMWPSFVVVTFIDGFLCANRYNKKAIMKALAQHDSEQKMTLTKNSNLDTLAKLAELKEKGVLSEEEFKSQKAKCLA